ncbi:uncharacterized protein A1O9_06603 [Exophiala aquamarina CBS 119918]|uniref:Glutathione S-transferase n=1 Tax=Exophiala aquamarina CBS 119918 TaxID=1182545 RepID=A0A072PFY8_9EURO|nr:uncharacterized protein A1O9_06603 [Exophiala aquamarina CBS 119918]KEF58677.1 hypothetical protein A1O9_06603 [Exophiala aquamarina CBS 119918]
MIPLLLHAHATSPNPLKIAIACQYLGVAYEVKVWEFGPDPRRGVKGEDFAKISPNGRLPALEDPNTGVLVWESGAIMNYLKRQYDKDGILGPNGPTPQDQVDLEKWEYMVVTTLGPMTGQNMWFRYYNIVRNDDAIERYTKQVYRCYDVLERQLGAGDGLSIVPGGITSVDCHCEPWIRPARYAGLTDEKYPRIKKWLAFMAEQQPVIDAYQKIKTATILQDPETAARGLQPDLSLMREAQAEAARV